jgi:lipopolysaccharide biosynthesis protein
VFAHCDGQGKIRDHTRAYIIALLAEGFDQVFVTNSGRLEPLDLAWIQARAARILIRRNLGYNFAAWRTVWRRMVFRQ